MFQVRVSSCPDGIPCGDTLSIASGVDLKTAGGDTFGSDLLGDGEMRRLALNEFAAEKGQTEAAALLGLRQGSLSKALRVGRSVIVTEHDDGTFSAEEMRPFPSQSKGQAA